MRIYERFFIWFRKRSMNEIRTKYTNFEIIEKAWKKWRYYNWNFLIHEEISLKDIKKHIANDFESFFELILISKCLDICD